MKKEEEVKVIIKVNEDYEMSCSCMDWRIRCRTNSIPCKHIYYLMSIMINYELYDYYDNQILEKEFFNS